MLSMEILMRIGISIKVWKRKIWNEQDLKSISKLVKLS